jgi:hypothetical protein
MNSKTWFRLSNLALPFNCILLLNRLLCVLCHIRCTHITSSHYVLNESAKLPYLIEIQEPVYVKTVASTHVKLWTINLIANQKPRSPHRDHSGFVEHS